MLLPGKGIPWKVFLLDLKREWVHDKVDTVAAALAFFGTLSIFPFLIFAVSLAGLLIDPAEASALIAQLYEVAPRAVADILSDRIRALTTTGQSPGLLTVGALGAIWAASGGVTSLMDALNTAYGVEDRRPLWKRRGLAILVTLGAAVLVTVASALAVATPAIAGYFGPLAPVILWARIPLSAGIVAVVLAMLYYVLPDVEQEFRFLTPGSIVAVALWLLASLGFSFYVARFGRYDVSYGALGGTVIFLLWMWISSMAVILGAEINAIIEHRTPEGKRAGARSMADAGPDVPKAVKQEQATAQRGPANGGATAPGPRGLTS